jgi:hypothetical protein
MNTGRLVTIAKFLDLIEARIVAGRLDAAGIPTHLPDVHHASANALVTVALGGVRLQVPADRVEEAKRILSEDVALDDDVCPTCGSADPACGHDRSGEP